MVWGLLLGVFGIGMVLRLHNLDAESLWMDEISTAIFSSLDLHSLVATISERNDAPLLYLVNHGFAAVLGDGEFALRFPAVLFGSLSVLLAFKVGETLWSWREGLLGAFLVALNAYHVHYSQEARQYGLMTFLALLSLVLLLKALQNNQCRLWIGFAAFASLGLYNHAFAFLVLFGEVVYAGYFLCHDWWTARGRAVRPTGEFFRVFLSPAKRSLMFLLSLFLIALSYLPWLPIFWTQASRHLASSPTAESSAGPLLSLAFLREVILTFSAGIGRGQMWVEPAAPGGYVLQEVADVAAWQGLTVLLFVALFLWGLAGCGRERLVLVLAWFVTPFVLLCFVTTRRFVAVRYVLYLLPLYLLLIARGTVLWSRIIDRCSAKAGLGGKRLALFAVAPAMLLGALSLASAGSYPPSPREDWRGVATYLQDNVASYDIVLGDGNAFRPKGDDGRVVGCLSYYLQSMGAPEAPILPVRPSVWRDLERVEHPDGEIWAVIWYPERPAAWDTVDEIIVTDFQDLAVLRLREPSGLLFDDTLRMLWVLVDLLPSEARFDVHLALAEIYLRTGSYEEARVELDLASGVKPESPQAARDLSLARAELERASRIGEKDLERVSGNLDNQIALLGYRIDAGDVRGKEPLLITLRWQVLAAMDRDYTLFIHLVGSDGRIWGQEDTLLGDGGLLTSAWGVGQVVTNEYQLGADPRIPSGEYAIQVGVYYWETGERLAVWDDSGGRLPGDTILLGHIVIPD